VFDATPAAEVWKRDRDFACTLNELAVGGRLLSFRTPSAVYDEVFLPLHGAHQGDNAAVALAAVEAFFGRALDPDIVFDAFASVRNPGRLEVVGREPLVILDGAHNPEGAIAEAESLADEFMVLGERRFVVGVLDGRDPHELLEILDVAVATEVICCTPDSPRALPASALAEVVESLGGSARVVADVDAAVELALAASSDDDLVVVTGSLYTVGTARAACRRLGLL
jgi:dihydrofolate synthase/folylpolyglutamate synthase